MGAAVSHERGNRIGIVVNMVTIHCFFTPQGEPTPKGCTAGHLLINSPDCNLRILLYLVIYDSG